MEQQIEFGNLYDVNKNLVENYEKPLSPTALREKLKMVKQYILSHDYYFMLPWSYGKRYAPPVLATGSAPSCPQSCRTAIRTPANSLRPVPPALFQLRGYGSSVFFRFSFHKVHFSCSTFFLVSFRFYFLVISVGYQFFDSQLLMPFLVQTQGNIVFDYHSFY